MNTLQSTRTLPLFLPTLTLSTLIGSVSCSDNESDVSDDPNANGAGGVTLTPVDDDPIVRPRSDDDDNGGTAGAGGQNDQNDVPPLQLCETVVGSSVSDAEEDPLVDDFEDGDPQWMGNGRVGFWYTYGDETGKLSPYGEATPSTPGRDGSSHALHVIAEDFTYWGSGVGTGMASDGAQACLQDSSAYTGVAFWIRGSVESTSNSVVDRDRGTVSLLLVEADVAPVEEGGNCSGEGGGCWDAHRVRFTPDECWQLLAFDFDEFEQDGWGQDGGELDLDELYRMHFQVAGYNDWDLWLDDVRFYVGDKPTEMEDCQIHGEGGASGR